jgi:hypothetical protein
VCFYAAAGGVTIVLIKHLVTVAPRVGRRAAVWIRSSGKIIESR